MPTAFHLQEHISYILPFDFWVDTAGKATEIIYFPEQKTNNIQDMRADVGKDKTLDFIYLGRLEMLPHRIARQLESNPWVIAAMKSTEIPDS
jgi:hypothetical protein